MKIHHGGSIKKTTWDGRRKKWYTGRNINTNYIIQRLVRKRLKKNEMSFWDLWDSISHTNVCVMGVPEGGGGEQVTEKIIWKNNG